MITFKEFRTLFESPSMSTEDLRGSSFSQQMFNIQKRHSEATHLGGNHYHLDDDDDQHFYHVNAHGKIDSISTVTGDEHIHGMFFKEHGVDSAIPLQNFKNALSVMGHIQSDTSHTKGSKNFWMRLHDKIPGIKIHVSNGTKKILHTKESLSKNEHKIWNDKTGDEQILHASI